MSKERELLKECRLMLDNPINGTAGRNLQIRITELLAQPETKQEPVAWIDPENYKQVIARADGALRYITRTPNDVDVPLYTSPQKRERLSDEAIMKIATKVCLEDMGIEMNPKDFKGTGVFELSKAIEKAHGIG